MTFAHFMQLSTQTMLLLMCVYVCVHSGYEISAHNRKLKYANKFKLQKI